MFLETFPVGPIQANCTLIGDRQAGEVAVIDPGEEAARIVERIEALELQATMILHTHGHLDHAGGTADLVRRLGSEVPVALHREDLPLYRNISTQGQMYGLEVEDPPEPTMWLERGHILEIGKLRLHVRHTPGHSPGSVSFVVQGEDPPIVIVGDVLFAGSIGRTDLMGGSFPILERSIREQLFTLPNSTRVICGHGPDTTIGHERATNPFVSG